MKKKSKCKCFFLYCCIVLANGHHCSDCPADVDGVKSFLNVRLWIFQGILGVVQNFETDVHHIILKLRDTVTGRLRENMREEQRKEKVRCLAGETSWPTFKKNRFQITSVAHWSVSDTTSFLSICNLSVCLSDTHTPSLLSSSLSSQWAVKEQALVCVVWLHSDTSCPEVSQPKPQCLRCHTAVTLYTGHLLAW